MLTGEVPAAAGGGIARYTDQMARALVEAGAEVVVFGPAAVDADAVAGGGYRLVTFDWPTLEKARHEGWRGEGPPPPERTVSNDFAIAWRLSEMVRGRAVREGPPDVIEAPEYKAIACYLKQRQLTDPGYLPGVPLVLMLHTPDFVVRRLNHEPRFTLPNYWIGVQERVLMHAADALVAPSAFIAGELAAREDLPLKSITVCPLPLYPSPPSGPRDPAPPPEDRVELAYFGRLELRKGIRELLRGCVEAWEAGREFRLVLIGGTTVFASRAVTVEDWIRDRYARWIEAGCLELTGELDREAAAERLDRARAVVVPSLWENFPYSCLEAMERGRPVLATPNGGMVEMLGEDGEAGRIFSWAQEGSFAAALDWLLGLSPAALETVGARARTRARAISDPSAVARRRLEHFHSIVAAARPANRFPFLSQDRTRRPRRARAAEERAGATTVVLPCFNLGRFLPDALESVRQSRFDAWTALVVDDGSTDEATRALLADLESRNDPQVRVLRQRNGGLASARNAGAGAATTEFVTFLDADDRLGPDFLARSIALLERFPNVDIAASWVQFFGEDTGIWRGWNLELPYLLLHNLMVPICTVRRQPFLHHGLNRPAMEYGLEDLDGWISMLEAGCGGVVIPEPLVFYRVRTASMFRSINRAAYLYLYDTIAEGHPRLMERYGTELYQLLNANGPAHEIDLPTSWGAPYDALLRQESTRHQAALAEAERQWRDSVQLRQDLQEARLAAEREWRTACELRQRVTQLDEEIRKLKNGAV